MLDTLRRHHRDIIALLRELDELTRAATPDADRLTGTRYRLTRASRARFLQIEKLYAELLGVADAACRPMLEALRAEGAAILSRSGAHISRWTPREIEAHWPAYCRESLAMRTAMHARIVREQTLLYPLLEALATKAA